jgi:hypothetical protein
VFEDDLDQCVSTGCTERRTHAVLADWNPFTHRPIMSFHCEGHGRSVAEGYIETPFGSGCRKVYFVTIDELNALQTAKRPA